MFDEDIARLEVSVDNVLFSECLHALGWKGRGRERERKRKHSDNQKTQKTFDVTELCTKMKVAR